MQQKSRCLIIKFFTTSTFVMYKIITRTAKFCCGSRTAQVVASTAATKLNSSRLVLLCCRFSLHCCMPYLSSHIFTFEMVTYTSLSYYVPKQEQNAGQNDNNTKNLNTLSDHAWPQSQHTT